MTEAVHVFQPYLSDSQATFWTGLLTALFSLAGTFMLLKRKSNPENRNFQQLGAMLLFFCFMIGAGMAFFSWWAKRKTGPVRIFTYAIETPYGLATFKNIKNAYMKEETRKSFINPNITTGSYKLLIIEEIDGKTHVLTEGNYDLEEIMKKLKESVTAWEAAN